MTVERVVADYLAVSIKKGKKGEILATIAALTWVICVISIDYLLLQILININASKLNKTSDEF